MIDPRELRIGNALLKNTEIWTTIADMYDLGVAIRHPEIYKPINLTEELLVKAGFEKLIDIEQDYNVGIAYSFRYGGIYDLLYVLKTEEGFLFADDYDSHIEPYFNCKLKGFHHLQNIVFDLTGKELSL